MCDKHLVNTFQDRIEINPRVCNGKPVLRDTRIPVQVIVEQIADGQPWQYVLDGYPALVREDIQAALLYASAAIEHTDILTAVAA